MCLNLGFVIFAGANWGRGSFKYPGRSRLPTTSLRNIRGSSQLQLKLHKKYLRSDVQLYSTQSATKILVSCGAFPLRLEAHTRSLPLEENIGKASKSG